MMYVMSVAFDPATSSVYTVSVPNARNRKLVVSRFDRKDLTLSEEFVPQLAAGGTLALSGTGRSLDEYFVTGATVLDGRLYALSTAYSTLLTIDLAKKAVTAAYVLQGLNRPVGIAFRKDQLYVLGDGGALSLFDWPANAD
jgi:disulfide bond formation protein DsbB